MSADGDRKFFLGEGEGAERCDLPADVDRVFLVRSELRITSFSLRLAMPCSKCENEVRSSEPRLFWFCCLRTLRPPALPPALPPEGVPREPREERREGDSSNLRILEERVRFSLERAIIRFTEWVPSRASSRRCSVFAVCWGRGVNHEPDEENSRNAK